MHNHELSEYKRAMTKSFHEKVSYETKSSTYSSPYRPFSATDDRPDSDLILPTTRKLIRRIPSSSTSRLAARVNWPDCSGNFTTTLRE
jgi:hypothetical protein